jgi:hypothetical protein
MTFAPIRIRTASILAAVLLPCFSAPARPGLRAGEGPEPVRLTALTLFHADSLGTVNPAGRWNTLWLDAAWDIAVSEGLMGPAFTPAWINEPTHLGIDIPFEPGQEKTYVFCISGYPVNFFGMNFFFDGAQSPTPGVPGISVVTYADVDGLAGDPIAFDPIANTTNTMGWPIADVGGSGTLVYKNDAVGIKVTLVDFVVYAQESFNLDFVKAQEPGGLKLTDGADFTNDTFGQFTLRVESMAKPPSDLLCKRSGDGKTADLSWAVNGTYDTLRIFRDDAEIASLPVTSTSYRDTTVPAGPHTWQVVSTADGESGGPSCTLQDPANPEVHLTGLTLFYSSEVGLSEFSGQWNTIYLDAAWDIALWEGTAPPVSPFTWANDPDNLSIDFTLKPGDEKTYGFCVSNVPPRYYGMNFFFDGAQSLSAPGISVVANAMATPEDPTPPFDPIGTNILTTGWPHGNNQTYGSGTLSWADADRGVRVTLTDFQVFGPDIYLLDLVQDQEPGGLNILTAGGDGVFSDLLGQFTLIVESIPRPPSDLVCTRSSDGATADLSWTLNGTYSSLKVLRDGAEIASLPVSSTSYRDASVPALAHTWQVLAEAGGETWGPSCTLDDPAHPEVHLTALTFFQANEQGSVNPAGRWNTLYLDGAWDIALWKGTVPPEVPVLWVNDPNNLGIDFLLQPGEERTYGFCVSGVAPTYFGMNFFFGGAQNPSPGIPAISVVTSALAAVEDPTPPFNAIATNVNTMGWAIADVPGAGTLSWVDAERGVRVTLMDFQIFGPDINALDLVQAQEPGGLNILTAGGDGFVSDLLGQFTLTVEFSEKPPSDLTCNRSQDGATVDLAWTVNGTYNAIRILRDGTEIASLQGSATSYQDAGVPQGTRSYQVVAIMAGRESSLSCTVEDPAHPELFLTALTFYGATQEGFVRPEERWNTLYLDAAWDIALHEGPIVTDPGQYDPSTFWLNRAVDMGVNLRLKAGEERTFSFYVGENPAPANWYGLNLFFDGQESPGGGTAGISVYAYTDEDGPDAGEPPPFLADAAIPTMGWPIADIPGAGTLVHVSEAKGLRVTLTDYAVYTTDALNVDFVQIQEPGGLLSIAASDGAADLVGQFTILVDSLSAPPAPEGLVATAGDARVTLSWGDVAGATGYNVYRGTASGGPYDKVNGAAIGATSFIDTDVANGNTYFYVVRAVGPGGESGNSNEAQATPQVSTGQFRRGDADGSGKLDLTDAIATLQYLYMGYAAPTCKDAADTDDSGKLDLTDAIASLQFQFMGGTPPASPGPTACGTDPTGDEYTECIYTKC